MSYDKHYGKPHLINKAIAEIVLPRIGCVHTPKNVEGVRFFLDGKGLVVQVDGWLPVTSDAQDVPAERFTEWYQLQWVDPNITFLTTFKDLLKSYDVGLEQCSAVIHLNDVPMIYSGSNAMTAPNLDLWEQCFSMAPKFYFTRTSSAIDKPHVLCPPTAPWETRLLVQGLLANPRSQVMCTRDGKMTKLAALRLLPGEGGSPPTIVLDCNEL